MGGSDTGPVPDEPAADDDLVRTVQPYEARKAYVCPGCNQRIDVGVGHVVVVPSGAADLRRHWHHACWSFRHRRRPGPA